MIVSATLCLEGATGLALTPLGVPDLLRRQGSSTWIEASSVPGLFPRPDQSAAEMSILDAVGTESQGPLSMKGIKIRPGFTVAYGDFQIFNPGSPTQRRRAPKHTMGVARVFKREIEFELVTLG